MSENDQITDEDRDELELRDRLTVLETWAQRAQKILDLLTALALSAATFLLVSVLARKRQP